MQIDFTKGDGLVPAIIQNSNTSQVLMLGYMNEEAYKKTKSGGKVTFFSRSRNRLWTKGETSGNYLFVEEIQIDCDRDTILIKAQPQGPTCHTGATSCFNEETAKGFLYQLEQTIGDRIVNNAENSYTNKLYKKGIKKIAQKLGEEAVELVIEAIDSDYNLLKNEAADLLYHFLVLLKAKDVKLVEIEEILKDRSKNPGR